MFHKPVQRHLEWFGILYRFDNTTYGLARCLCRVLVENFVSWLHTCMRHHHGVAAGRPWTSLHFTCLGLTKLSWIQCNSSEYLSLKKKQRFWDQCANASMIPIRGLINCDTTIWPRPSNSSFIWPYWLQRPALPWCNSQFPNLCHPSKNTSFHCLGYMGVSIHGCTPNWLVYFIWFHGKFDRNGWYLGVPHHDLSETSTTRLSPTQRSSCKISEAYRTLVPLGLFPLWYFLRRDGWVFPHKRLPWFCLTPRSCERYTLNGVCTRRWPGDLPLLWTVLSKNTGSLDLSQSCIRMQTSSEYTTNIFLAG